MQPKLLDKIFVILCKETGQYVSFGSKCAWVSSGAAKGAYNCHVSAYPRRRLFDEQNEYILVDIEV